MREGEEEEEERVLRRRSVGDGSGGGSYATAMSSRTKRCRVLFFKSSRPLRATGEKERAYTHKDTPVASIHTRTRRHMVHTAGRKTEPRTHACINIRNNDNK